MYDTHILIREKSQDGTISDWEEIPVCEPRRLLHSVWNPTKRKNKLVVDAISQVKSIKNAGELNKIPEDVVQNQIRFSKGYLTLLNIVVQKKNLFPNSTARQFAVFDATHISGTRNLIPLFVSPFHLL